MTPDELRRMDNDLCIIYEKGIKPIKANKYYYFKYPEGKIVSKFKVDHNDVHVDRGVWRKFNPYNPYQEGDENKSGGMQNSLESLDDLFAEDSTDSTNKTEALNSPLGMTAEEKKAEEKRQEELSDIQKELEAKFDELFGSIDSE